MNFHKLVFLSLFICLGNTTLKACSCEITGFCQLINDTTVIVEARVIEKYDAVNSSYHFMDVEITDLLNGADSLSYDTLTLSHSNSSCETPLFDFAQPGDSFVFKLLELGSEPEAQFPTFSLSECAIGQLSIQGDSVKGIFDTSDPNFDFQALAYDSFKSNIGNCGSLISTSSLPPFAIDLGVFPNPAQESLIVKTMQIQSITYTIYSNDGKIIKSGRSTQQRDFTIDIRDISSGLYFLQLQANEQTVSKKFMKL